MSAFSEALDAHCRNDGRASMAIAQAACIDASYLSRMRRGEREPPRAEVVSAICKALNLLDQETDRMHALAGHPTPLAMLVTATLASGHLSGPRAHALRTGILMLLALATKEEEGQQP